MTAKEYLISQLKDPWPEATSTETRIGLIAYYMRIQRDVDGYSLDDLEKLVRSCGLSDEFFSSCESFISNISNYYELKESVPKYLED